MDCDKFLDYARVVGDLIDQAHDDDGRQELMLAFIKAVATIASTSEDPQAGLDAAHEVLDEMFCDEMECDCTVRH
jgi:hypothetical protein